MCARGAASAHHSNDRTSDGAARPELGDGEMIPFPPAGPGDDPQGIAGGLVGDQPLGVGQAALGELELVERFPEVEVGIRLPGRDQLGDVGRAEHPVA